MLSSLRVASYVISLASIRCAYFDYIIATVGSRCRSSPISRTYEVSLSAMKVETTAMGSSLRAVKVCGLRNI